MALILRRRGIKRVRPLAGGFHAWRDRGFPVATLDRPTPLPAVAAPGLPVIGPGA